MRDGSTAFVTFDLTGHPLGSYDVGPTNPVGTTTDLAAGLTVVPAATERVQLQLIVPQGVLVGHPGTLTVDYTNPGNTDLPAPLLLLNAQNALFQAPGQTAYSSGSLQLLAYNPDGPFGTLPPGFQGSITLSFKPVTAGVDVTSQLHAANPARPQ